jgi:hypothetical protein
VRDFNDKEQKLIDELRNCFRKCGRSGLFFSGMDGELIVCNQPAYNKADKERSDQNGDYNQVAYAAANNYQGQTIVLSGYPYVDSGAF